MEQTASPVPEEWGEGGRGEKVAKEEKVGTSKAGSGGFTGEGGVDLVDLNAAHTDVTDGRRITRFTCLILLPHGKQMQEGRTR